jgi:hypothetical protein
MAEAAAALTKAALAAVAAAPLVIHRLLFRAGLVAAMQARQAGAAHLGLRRRLRPRQAAPAAPAQAARGAAAEERAARHLAWVVQAALAVPLPAVAAEGGPRLAAILALAVLAAPAAFASIPGEV